MKDPRIGRVTLVGAGPGDPELLTVKALKAIQEAKVIVYDRLVSPAILALAQPGTRRINAGKHPGRHSIPQNEINELLVSLAFQGLDVVRLKGGDPLIFGRGGEEMDALRDAGIGCSCIPGITAAQGAASSLRIPLTHRGLSTGIRYVTGHRAADGPLDLDWASLASGDTTLVVYMGAAAIAEIAAALMAHGLADSTPVLAVASATTGEQTHRLTKLGEAGGLAMPKGRDKPVLFIIGQVAALAGRKEAPHHETDRARAYQ